MLYRWNVYFLFVHEACIIETIIPYSSSELCVTLENLTSRLSASVSAALTLSNFSLRVGYVLLVETRWIVINKSFNVWSF